MVKLALDTNRDELLDLEEALEILQEAITRRRAAESIEIDQEPQKENPSEPDLVAGKADSFLELTVESEDTLGEEPTLNELLSNESITENELTDMFEKHNGGKPKKKSKKEPPKTEGDEDAFIEIVEFEDDESDE